MPRIYPVPDPFERLIDREEAPPSIWAMPPQERAHRIRIFLLGRNLLGRQNSDEAWREALLADSQSTAEFAALLDRWSDDAILADMEVADTRWAEYRRRVAAGEPLE